MLGDYSEFENICKVLVCNELVKGNYGICLIVFQQVSHSSCAPAVADDDHAEKDIWCSSSSQSSSASDPDTTGSPIRCSPTDGYG